MTANDLGGLGLEGRVALVTGATSGIGLAIARRLAGREYCVVVHSRSSTEAGNALAAELGDAGPLFRGGQRPGQAHNRHSPLYLPLLSRVTHGFASRAIPSQRRSSGRVLPYDQTSRDAKP